MKRQGKKRKTQGHTERKNRRKTGRLAKAAKTPKAKVYKHPVYGEIPLVIRTLALASGESREYWVIDPEFRPRIPRGAVRADLSAQVTYYGTPRFFYTDETKRCFDCEEDYVFSAKEKKFWYETLKFTFDSHAIRCVPCRRKLRRVKGLHRELARSLGQLEGDPKNPVELLALAEATVLLWQLTGTGNLERALAASRKAARLWSDKKKKVALSWQTKIESLRAETALAASI